jgi:hypothetical protein
MANIVNITTKREQAELIRLRELVRITRELTDARMEALEAIINAMLPEHEGAARYQRQRAIASDKGKSRDFLEGK